MSRRGNCHDNAVAESFFNLLKRERIRRKVYRTRDEARREHVFDYIEMFYNPTRKHARNGMLSPIEFERQHKNPKPKASRKLGAVQYALLADDTIAVENVAERLPQGPTQRWSLDSFPIS
ncbi:MAG: hypothetical protein AcusKO_25110 [Acuticoccus sp.]